MARDRERARDRKRRAREGAGGDAHAGEQPINASGEVDEFEAAMAADGAAPGEAPGEAELEAEALAARGDLDGDGDIDADDDALLPEAAPAKAPITRAQPGTPTTSGGGPRFLQFLRASWAELQRVQWPDRRQVAQATAVVLGFVVVAGAYLGVADWAAQKLVDFIL